MDEARLKEIIYNIIQQASMLGSTYEDSAMSEENYKIAFEKIETEALKALLALTNLRPLEKDLVSKLLYEMTLEGASSKECASAICSEFGTPNLRPLDEKEVEKIKDSLMYDFPKHYNNSQIIAYQKVIEYGCKKLVSHFSKPVIKYPKKKKFSINDRIKYGDDYVNKIVWQNEMIDDMRKLNGGGE